MGRIIVGTGDTFSPLAAIIPRVSTLRLDAVRVGREHSRELEMVDFSCGPLRPIDGERKKMKVIHGCVVVSCLVLV